MYLSASSSFIAEEQLMRIQASVSPNMKKHSLDSIVRDLKGRLISFTKKNVEESWAKLKVTRGLGKVRKLK